jgi:hypothetical protein
MERLGIMKRSLQRHKGEPLHKWLDRMTEEILLQCSDWDNYRPILRDMLGEISKESYIEGVTTERELEKKYNK